MVLVFPDLLSDSSLPLRLRISQPHEENEFRSLLNEIPMKKGNVSITTDFPSPLRAALESDRRGYTIPILFEDSSGHLGGCASFTVWDEKSSVFVGLHSHEPNFRVGYFADLRLSTKASRDLRNHWRAVYRNWVEQLQSTDSPVNLKSIVTSVLDENKIAVRALGRGRDGIHYLPLYSYNSLSQLLQTQTTPETDTKTAAAFLKELGVTYTFQNPNRKWIVEVAQVGVQEISYFTLSQLDGFASLTDAKKEHAWRAILTLSQAWAALHSRTLFQVAAIGSRPEYWDIKLESEIQRWESPATLFQVTTQSPQTSTPVSFKDGQYIDASQL